MECRTATASDKEAIIAAFPGIYGGRDYLAFEYDKFMQKDEYTCFVGEIDGNIVAFAYTQLLDHNVAYVDGGVRIHVDYRGRGLMNQLTGYVDQYMKNKYSSICQKKTACLNTEENLEKLKRHPERCIVWEKVTIWHTMQIDDLKNRLSCALQQNNNLADFMEVKEHSDLTWDEKLKLKNHLHDYGSHCKDILGIYWVPYGHYDDNLDDILLTTSWLIIPKHSLCNKYESLRKLILVKQYTCQLGLACFVEFLYREADIDEGDLYSVITKVCSEAQPHFERVALLFFCDTPYAERLRTGLAMLFGQVQFEYQGKVIFLKQQIKC